MQSTQAVDDVVFLIMRRMRMPLILLIATYAAAIAGLVVIPAQDALGQPTPMGFFHAFYVIAYTGTTIGFGELPYPFTEAQRLWMSLCIFVTVGVWLYTIGALIALLQDSTLQRVMAERRFRAQVRRFRAPFVLVCGYGQTGGVLVRELTDRRLRVVVLDSDAERINRLALEAHRDYVPALCADARKPATLEAAGLRHPLCQAVVALSSNNEVNLKIAIVAKLLHPRIKVICRADAGAMVDNLASFGTDHIYDPFETFALYISTAVEAPCLTLLLDWLYGVSGESLKEPIYPPSKGRWVICGYGRFGKAMYRELKDQGLDLTVVESEPDRTGMPPDGLVAGRGTDTATLEEAGVQRAVGLVAATDKDADNLAIIMTARALNADLFVIARENHLENHELFERVGVQVTMHPSSIIAHRIRVRLALPMLSEFLTQARFQDDAWACQLISRIAALAEESVPHVWQIRITEGEAPALCEAESLGTVLTLDTLLRDPGRRERHLKAIPLLLEHKDQRVLQPELAQRVKIGDQVLFCGRREARARMERTLRDGHVLHFVATGEDAPRSALWRWLDRRHRRAKSGRHGVAGP